MKAEKIVVGGHYTAKVSGKIVPVRVDAITEATTRRPGTYGASAPRLGTRTIYEVTNLATGRKLTFRSAQKFRGAYLKGVEVKAKS